MYLLDHPISLFIVAVAVLLLAHEAGFRLRALARHREEQDWEKQVHETRNQIAVLLSLLLGFTMSMALARFDERKHLVIDEANAIGTVYLRATMQAEPVRSKAPALLREYVDSLLAMHRKWMRVATPPSVPCRFKTSFGAMLLRERSRLLRRSQRSMCRR